MGPRQTTRITAITSTGCAHVPPVAVVEGEERGRFVGVTEDTVPLAHTFSLGPKPTAYSRRLSLVTSPFSVLIKFEFGIASTIGIYTD